MPIDLSGLTPLLPPDELIDRVTPGVAEETADPSRAAFHASGQRSVRDVELALSAVGKDWFSFESILEFGCGCGRIMLWLEEVGARAQLHGCDIDEQAVSWAGEHLSFAHFAANPHEPPLPYGDESFDLIYNHSVFTHLDERMQDLWLGELRRVTRRGGLVLLTVHGEKVFEDSEAGVAAVGDDAAAWRAEVEQRGILFVDQDSYVGSSFPDFYHTTYHAPWYVFEHWAQFFTVRAYIPRGSLGHQDFVLLERPLDDAPVPNRPLRARPAGGAASVSTEGTGLERPIDAAEAAVERSMEPAGDSRYGAPGDLARRLLMRVARPYAMSQRRVDHAILAALRDLDNRAALIRMPPLVKDVLDRQSERIGRLDRAVERDLADLDRRMSAVERREPS